LLPDNAVWMNVPGRLAAVLALLAVTTCGSPPIGPGAQRPPALRAAQGGGVASISQRTSASSSRPTVRLLFVGASVTAGYGADNPDHAFPELVASHLRAAGWNTVVHIAARPGATTADAANWSLTGPADAVVVHLVTNDFSRGTPLATYQADYGDVIRKLRVSSPSAKLVCLGGWSSPTSVNSAGITAERYSDIARTVCTANRGTFVNLSVLYLQKADHGPAGGIPGVGLTDHFHPNDRGHRQLAAAVLRELAIPARASGRRATV
jgi:lysophospholipase L1-like esterase